MNHSVPDCGIRKIGGSPAIIFSTPAIGCVLDLPALPGGGSKIYDRSPYGNIGTITGATWIRTPGGLWCLSFDGSDDYVNCGKDASLDITSAITIEAWTKLGVPLSEQQNDASIIYKHGGSPTKGYYLEQRGWDDTTRFALFDQDSVFHTRQVSAPNDLNWHHIVGTFNGSSQVLYLDTVGTAPLSWSGTISAATTKSLMIGGGEAGRYFNGLIALPRIYNRALSALEIQNHFNREKNLFGVW